MGSFKEIFIDLLKIIADLTAFTMKNFINIGKSINISIIYNRNGNENFGIFYGDGDNFYKDIELNFEYPGDIIKNLANITDIYRVGSTFILSVLPRTYEQSVCLPVICAFNKPPNDITPKGYRVDYYEIQITLLPNKVEILYRAWLLGPNGTPMYQFEDLGNPKSFYWFGSTNSPYAAETYDRIIDDN